MIERIGLTIVLVAAMAMPAWADATAAGKDVSAAFQKACSAGDIASVMQLYEDDATVIWPGQGETATGKAAIEKLARNLCKPDGGELKMMSQESKAIGRDYIVNVGRWQTTVPGPDGKPTAAEIRTTELLHRSAGKWRYAIDHASIGLPPAQTSASR